ncbi:MAG: DUF7550 family protein [Halobacteriota archaeon]
MGKTSDHAATRMADDAADDLPTRTTAPQSPFGAREIRIGVLVLAIGLVITLGIPLLTI